MTQRVAAEAAARMTQRVAVAAPTILPAMCAARMTRPSMCVTRMTQRVAVAVAVRTTQRIAIAAVAAAARMTLRTLRMSMPPKRG